MVFIQKQNKVFLPSSYNSIESQVESLFQELLKSESTTEFPRKHCHQPRRQFPLSAPHPRKPPRRHASITQAFELMTPPPPAKITQALRGRTTRQTVNKTFSLGSPCFGSFPAGSRITTTHCGGVLGRQRHTQQVTRSKLARKQSTQTAASGSGSSRTEKVLSLQRLYPTVAPYTHASTTPHREILGVGARVNTQASRGGSHSLI